MQRKCTFAEGEFYHVYNRGVEKREIFRDFYDQERLIRLMFLSNGKRPFKYRDIQDLPFAEIDRGEPLVAIGAYVFMPNHFHILVKEIKEGGITAFMEKMMTGYSSFFNKRHKRVGPLFQDRFKATHVDDDNYLKYLYSYIHLNPVKLIDPLWKENGIADKSAAKEYLGRYRYSSYADHTGNEREERAILAPEEFPEYFAKPQEFDTFIDDWLGYKDEEEEEGTSISWPALLQQVA